MSWRGTHGKSSLATLDIHCVTVEKSGGLGMSFGVTATIDEESKVSGVRREPEEALKLALEYQRLGYRNIKVEAPDAVYTLHQFRLLLD